ncbi:MAG: hypothetical protein LUB61_02935, partial [Eggerthellaceae bacterium]|nr:hypothetical protein [Eggerthellaceae bacterium]
MVGQIYATAGEPVTISGFAQNVAAPVTGVQLSCDEGRTWSLYETPDPENARDVDWAVDFIPPEEGYYHLLVSALDANHKPSLTPA